MRTDGKRTLSFTVSVVIALSLWLIPVFASEFTADMVETKTGAARTSKLSVKGNRYAVEYKEGGLVDKLTVDQDKNVTRFIMISDKKVMMALSDSMASLSNDPIQAAREAAKRYESKKEGTENISGYLCDKIVVSTHGKKVMTEWVSRDLNFPLKIERYGQSTWTMELKNIKPGSVQETIFTIPEDYDKFDRTKSKKRKPEIPATGVTSMVKGNVPMGKRLGPGGEMRVSLSGTRSAKVYLKNLPAGESIVTVTPYRSGNQVESIGVSPTKLKNRFETWNREFNSPSTLKMSSSFKVDEIRIKVEKGLVTARVEEKSKADRYYSNCGGRTTWIRLNPAKPLAITVTGDNQDCNKSQGKILVKRKDGTVAVNASFTVENGKNKMWNYPASDKISDVQITVGEGEGMI